MTKKLFFYFLLLFIGKNINAQVIAGWQLNGALGTEVTKNATTSVANMSVPVLSRNGGINATALGNSISSTNFPASGTQLDAYTNGRGYYFSFSANVGYKVSLASLDYRVRRSSTGPNAFIWQYSTNGTTFTDIGTPTSYTATTTNGDNQPQIVLSGISALQSVASGTTITLRLVAWGATATGGTFAIGRSTTTAATDYSLQLAGSVFLIPTAPTTSSITSGTTSMCSGSTTNLNVYVTGGSSPYTVTYTNGTSNFTVNNYLSGTNIPITPTSTKTYTLVSVVDAASFNSLTLTGSPTITVNPSPTVGASASVNPVCLGVSTTLSGSGATSYTWNNGVTNNSSFIPSASTNYIVTGTDANNCTATSSVSIVVNTLPTVTASSSATSICAGQNITLNGGGTTGVTYTWSNGAINNTPFTPTSISYIVTGTDANACTATSTITININALPNVTASSTATTFCAGQVITLNGGGASTYSWNNGAPNNSSFIPTIAGTYQVTGTDANNCTATSTLSLTINPLPTVTASTSAAAVCDGQSVILNGGGATTYSWSNFTPNNTSFVPTNTDIYQVTGTDANSCTATSTVQVVVNNLPAVTASATATSVCSGQLVTLNGGGASSYIWNNSVTNNTSFTPTATATYIVTGMDANSCTATTTIDVIVNPLPTVTASASQSTICNGNSTELTAGGATTYSWDNANLNAVQTVIPSTTTTYIVTGSDGTCASTSAVTVIVNNLSSNLVPTTSTSTLNQTDNSMVNYTNASCELIATVNDGAGGNILGSTQSNVTMMPTVGVYNGQPYVRRWYEITPTNNGAATITLYLTQADFDDYNLNNGSLPDLPLSGSNTDANIANVRITKVSGGTLGIGTPTVITPTMNWNGNYWEATFPVTGFSQFYFHSVNPNNSALPVTITDFHGQKSTNSNLIYWTTTNENNSNYFNLLYSTNGNDFSLLKKINSKAINGTSNEIINYNFEHEKPTLGHNYYKLEQVDIDGKTTVNTNIVDLNWGSNGSTISIYPNPISEELNIDIYTSKVENSNVKILDMSGRVIKETNSKLQIGANNLKLNLTELASGIYTVQILENNIITQISKVEKK